MKKRIFYIWLTLQLLFLGYIEYQLYFHEYKDTDLVFSLVELYLNFPSSLVVAFIGSILSEITDINQHYQEPYVKMAYVFFSWVLFIIMGYIQWFLFLPYIFNKINFKWSQRK